MQLTKITLLLGLTAMTSIPCVSADFEKRFAVGSFKKLNCDEYSGAWLSYQSDPKLSWNDNKDHYTVCEKDSTQTFEDKDYTYDMSWSGGDGTVIGNCWAEHWETGMCIVAGFSTDTCWGDFMCQFW
ncbi:uncharacterized protein EHS24_008278 [Apiotrichum porosum]|uniref:Uncharacterized protein n=1 Tax=Apiotrichum porosum TaxID=105984 RepID=A0A427XTA9_9TREE|nr:uncharacterized protein EHS24_008278 [Apiotrichum porosum]RSH82074.1 hypothetical protein EHS24_008278 [Apiotrichum porosum]